MSLSAHDRKLRNRDALGVLAALLTVIVAVVAYAFWSFPSYESSIDLNSGDWVLNERNVIGWSSTRAVPIVWPCELPSVWRVPEAPRALELIGGGSRRYRFTGSAGALFTEINWLRDQAQHFIEARSLGEPGVPDTSEVCAALNGATDYVVEAYRDGGISRFNEPPLELLDWPAYLDSRDE